MFTEVVGEDGTKYNETDATIVGGTPLKRGYLFDGKSWRKTAPMMQQRVSPVCSLVEMDDGEVIALLMNPSHLQAIVSHANHDFISSQIH